MATRADAETRIFEQILGSPDPGSLYSSLFEVAIDVIEDLLTQVECLESDDNTEQETDE